MALKLMYITNRSDVALIAEKYGVDRIWIDLETLGKEERQKGMNTVKSNHTVDDVRRIKPLLSTSEMLVRVNPWNENSEKEIEDVVSAGADIIMLPMWKSAAEVTKFLSVVDGRCKTTLLLETKEAVECLDEVLENGGMDEIHIGLNDLHLSYPCFSCWKKLNFHYNELHSDSSYRHSGYIHQYHEYPEHSQILCME